MVKKALKDTYLGGKTPKALQNEVFKCRIMYYDKEARVMVNQSVNDFYTWFLFKMDALPHNIMFPFEIAATFFNNLILDIRELLASEAFHIHPRLSTETNQQGKHRLLLVRSVVAEPEKKKRTIKVAVQAEIRIFHPGKFMGMLEGNSTIQMYRLGSSF